MKVILLNGSIHKDGTTAAALAEVAIALQEEGIETETVHLGAKPISDCLACMQCRGKGRCVIDDGVNEFIEKASQADGFVFGTPVYYAHPSGRILSFLDRVFYAGGASFRFKPGASVAVARRAGTVASFDVLNKYFTISSMPVVSSTYWNNVFGANGDDAHLDEEGMCTMRNIGKNMAWMLNCIKIAKQNGIMPPEQVRARTNFIR